MSHEMSPEMLRQVGAAITPFNPVTGAAMLTVGTVHGQKTFEVQPDMLPKLLDGLDRVRGKYQNAQDLAVNLSNVQPPAWDDVTKHVTKGITQRAQGGENSLFDTAEGMIKWIDDFKTAVKQAIRDYENTDEDNRMA